LAPDPTGKLTALSRPLEWISGSLSGDKWRKRNEGSENKEGREGKELGMI